MDMQETLIWWEIAWKWSSCHHIYGPNPVSM